MTFSPAIPLTGFAGWAILQRTKDSQTATMVANAQYKRDEDYFRANIGKIDTAEQLVADRRLLGVALAAYGLEGDINNKYFIQKILSDGTLKTDALANRLADKQYQKLSAAFGFGDFSTPRNKLSDFADKTLALYKARSFETAVGTQNDDFRLAMNLQRELPEIASKTTSSENAKWFTVMGNTPLRKVFETALGLPSSTATLDLDAQLSVFKSRAKAHFGADSVSQFSDSAAMDKLVRRFLLRSETNAFSASAGNAALTMLQQSVAFAYAQRR